MKYLLVFGVLVVAGCLSGEEGKLQVINETEESFQYRVVVFGENEKIDSARHHALGNENATVLMPGESSTVDLVGKYEEGGKIAVFIYKESDSGLKMVKSEVMGVKYLQDTFWSAVVIDSL